MTPKYYFSHRPFTAACYDFCVEVQLGLSVKMQYFFTKLIKSYEQTHGSCLPKSNPDIFSYF